MAVIRIPIIRLVLFVPVHVHLRDNMYFTNFSKTIKFPVRPAGRLLLAL